MPSPDRAPPHAAWVDVGVWPAGIPVLDTLPEAPRGLLLHQYVVGDDGKVEAATIVPPTSQDRAAIEADLATFTPRILDLPIGDATHQLEQLIRSYDPCISCATHFLDLSVEQVP